LIITDFIFVHRSLLWKEEREKKKWKTQKDLYKKKLKLVGLV